MSLTRESPPTDTTQTDLSGLFVAVIVYACDVDAPDHVTLYEESFTLIRASSTEEATAKAEAFAHRPLPQYKNGQGQQVTWTFKAIVDLRHLLTERMGDAPEELLARHFENYDAYDAFVSSVEARSGGPAE